MKKNNKIIINKIINLTVLLLVICLFVAFLYRKNITSYINNKKLLKQATEVLEDKNNIYLMDKKYKENNINTSFYFLLNAEKKEVIIMNLKENCNPIINTISLEKIPKIANNDLIKLEVNISARDQISSYYTNINVNNNIFYFTLLDGSMYKTKDNIKLPDNIIKDILNNAEYLKLLELNSTSQNIDILFSEKYKKIAMLSKMNNKYVSLNYLDPYISSNNNYNEHKIKNLLIEYKTNYNPDISLNIKNNNIFNTRNAYSKFVTIISTDNIRLMNIRPAGGLYNILFELNDNIYNEKTIIK